MPVKNITPGADFITCHHWSLVNLYDCHIGIHTTIGAFVEIGKGAVVGERCRIQSHVFIPSGVTIGSNVFIGPHVCFTNIKKPKCDVINRNYEKTYVEDDVVIGAGAVILPGVRIGQGAFIGAGAVVTKDVRGGAVVVGNPARELKTKEKRNG